MTTISNSKKKTDKFTTLILRTKKKKKRKTKKIVFLRFDVKKSFFWIYSKKIKNISKKILTFKKRFTH